jgi:hypothetical protein
VILHIRLNGLAVLLHRWRERKNYIDAALILGFPPDVIFDDQDFVGSHFASVVGFAGGVGGGKDFVPHGDLMRDVSQTAESDDRNTVAALRPRRPKGAHRGKAAAEEWSGQRPWQVIGQQSTTVGFSDHVIGVTAAVSDPGLGFRSELEFFCLGRLSLPFTMTLALMRHVCDEVSDPCIASLDNNKHIL